MQTNPIQVFTPHFCKVLAEANAIVRHLRKHGIRAMRLSLNDVRHGLPAELIINSNAPRIESSLVHITHDLRASVTRSHS